MEKKGLTPKQRRFIQEYLIDLNATQAALRTGYSKRTARSQGQRLLTNVDIQKAIQEGMAKRESRTQVKQDAVLMEVAKVAFCDIRKVFKPGGFELVPPHKLPKDVAAAISSIKKKVKVLRDKDGNETEFINYKYTFWDKLRALDKLFRHLGLYNDKLNLGADDDLKALLKRIDGRGLPKPG